MTNCDVTGLPGPPGPTGWGLKGDRGEFGSPVSEFVKFICEFGSLEYRMVHKR